MNLQTKTREILNPNSSNHERKAKLRTNKIQNDECYLEFDLVLLGFLKGNVVFCQSSLPLPVLQQYEPDLPFTKRKEKKTKDKFNFIRDLKKADIFIS